MSNSDFESLSFERQCELIEHGNKWHWQTFWVGIAKKCQNIIFSREFLVFCIVTVMVRRMDLTNNVVWISYLAVSVVFILAESIRILIAENTKMNIEAKVGASVAKEVKKEKISHV